MWHYQQSWPRIEMMSHPAETTAPPTWMGILFHNCDMHPAFSQMYRCSNSTNTRANDYCSFLFHNFPNRCEATC